VITLLDTFLLLYLQKLGMRKMEAFIIALIAIIGGCFITEIFLAKPDLTAVAGGFVPHLPNSAALYIAIGIIGATVMPHNLYLHSALVQTRKIGNDEASKRRAIRFNTIDSAIALNIAFFVNAAILILAGTVFYQTGHHQVESIQDAHKLLAPLLGSKWAAILFAVALVAAGQSSTITGTLAGQIIMEGYLHLRLSPVARRLITRLLAIVPAVITIWVSGEQKVDDLLVFSQVLLSMQLAFAVIPLIHFVSDKAKMGVFAINTLTKTVAWLVASVILSLNIKLFADSVVQWFTATSNIFLKASIIIFVCGITVTLLFTIFYPLVLKRKERARNIHKDIPAGLLNDSEATGFGTVALALDFTDKDQKVVAYALMLARPQTRFVLIHIVESVSARVMGQDAHDMETQRDKEFLDKYTSLFLEKGYPATGILGFKSRVNEIARIVTEQNCELLVIGSHGHKIAKDWIFGETINSVRHKINIPVFIAR
jgi:manganese transport protein